MGEPPKLTPSSGPLLASNSRGGRSVHVVQYSNVSLVNRPMIIHNYA